LLLRSAQIVVQFLVSRLLSNMAATPTTNVAFSNNRSSSVIGSVTQDVAERGARQCHRWREIVVMLNHYGYLLPRNDIDHPDVGKNNRRVHVRQSDMIGRSRRAQVALDCYDGDFTDNYADVSSNDGDESSICESDALFNDEVESHDVFVGLTNYKELAQCFHHDDDYESAFVGLTNYKELAQCFHHDDDYESAFVGLTNYKELAQCFRHDDYYESTFVGLTNHKQLAECFRFDEDYDSDDGLVVIHAPFKAQEGQSDVSTSAGASSGSEKEFSDCCTIDSSASQRLAGFDPPPGLSL